MSSIFRPSPYAHTHTSKSNSPRSHSFPRSPLPSPPMSAKSQQLVGAQKKVPERKTSLLAHTSVPHDYEQRIASCGGIRALIPLSSSSTSSLSVARWGNEGTERHASGKNPAGKGVRDGLEVELGRKRIVGDRWKESCPRRSDRRILPAAKTEVSQGLD
ncbi:hypothetical protein GMDG_03118 [Pseudogymnoascus destructans 20631-21]|uniref:Uncharacterized protein n=1 Tax=Pseudogymnoascus destructans (strain ATCC MYA-4855 / 20631-21) TaxID=658429 RepID=L8G6L5_PSED2|nr:hypothetical protein GMDG_03118 [Pseudogymnoascus destructans 20631-21]